MGGSRRLEYQPALDGVRALAVLAVLLFHAGTPGFGGGYLGVSVFFTLSGYLITSLLLDEHEDSGTVDYRRFYGRRLRRLLPASVATVAAVVILSAVTGLFDAVVGLRAQVVGALLQVSNWVLLRGDSSYQDLLAQASGAASPLEHFWSLAIEEQFYWLWPPVMLLVLSRVPSARSRMIVVAVMTGLAMVVAPLIAQVWGPDAAYWATPARLGEILVGALLAFVIRTARLPRHISKLAPAALVVMAVAVVTFPSSSGPAYEGLLPVFALVSGALILGLQADGTSRRLLSLVPLVALGKMSYGVYLVHWPVFVVFDAERVGVDGVALTTLRLSITLVIALASYYLLERPIRMRQRVPFGITLGAAALGTIALVAVALVVMPNGPSTYWRNDPATIAAAAIDTDQAPVALTRSTTAPPTTDPTANDPTAKSATADAAGGAVPTTSTPLVALPELARPVRIVVTGDSTGDALGTGVVGWAAANQDLAQVEVEAAFGCGFLMGGDRLVGDEFVSTSSCDDWPEVQLMPLVEHTTPDLVAVMTTAWDILDRRWEDGEVLGPDDPEYRTRLVDTYTALVDDLVAAGAARVALIRQPVSNGWWRSDSLAEDDPRRHAALAEVYAEVAAARPDVVRVIDLATWFTAAGLDTDRVARPDGIHLAPDAATSIANDFLGEQLIRAAVI